MGLGPAERTEKGMEAADIINTINMKSQSIGDANVAAFNLPCIPSLGTVGGFDFRYQDYLAGDLGTFIDRANAIIAQHIAGLDLLIGISAGNSILIIEFCKEQRETGVAIIDTVMNAAHLRFRPIMMTILSFLFGVLPLAFATGAGAMTMRSIGIVIMSGMIAATFVSTLLVPVIDMLLETVR